MIILICVLFFIFYKLANYIIKYGQKYIGKITCDLLLACYLVGLNGNNTSNSPGVIKK
jgi:hypothetical protein